MIRRMTHTTQTQRVNLLHTWNPFPFFLYTTNIWSDWNYSFKHELVEWRINCKASLCKAKTSKFIHILHCYHLSINSPFSFFFISSFFSLNSYYCLLPFHTQWSYQSSPFIYFSSSPSPLQQQSQIPTSISLSFFSFFLFFSLFSYASSFLLLLSSIFPFSCHWNWPVSIFLFHAKGCHREFSPLRLDWKFLL